jgi:Right handed beta helix region
MPANPGEKEAIWAQRARVSGNVCSHARRYHGIQITHASQVLVIGNECAYNPRSGIQLVDSAFVRVEANTCRYNLTGIRESVDGCVEDAGHNLIRNNTLEDNMYDDVVRTKTDECQR